MSVTEVGRLPDDLLNFVGISPHFVGWDGDQKAVVVAGLHVPGNGTDPFTSSTMVFSSVDFSTGNVTRVANGTTQCATGPGVPAGCEGDLPVTAVGVMDGQGGSKFINLFKHSVGHKLMFPPSLVGTTVSNASVTFNTSFGASFYQMARMPTGTIVGLGLCCDGAMYPAGECPAACGAHPPGSMAMLSWAKDRYRKKSFLRHFEIMRLSLKPLLSGGKKPFSAGEGSRRCSSCMSRRT
eukprot:COSAG06_NODE_1005_length_11116_cov_4.520468_2_plen_238_part_00